MNKKIVTALALVLFLGGGSSTAFAEVATSTVAGADVTALQAKIEMLMKQIEVLKATLNMQHSEVKMLRTELWLTERLRIGSMGNEVKTLQELLATDPEIYPEGVVSGVFGPLTQKAIRRFQEKNNLESVGEVGPRTLEILNRILQNDGAGISGKIPPGLLKKVGHAIMIPLVTQNNSGVKGWARIMDNSSGKAVVSIELMKENSTEQDNATLPRPAHIHAGACPTPGAVTHPLSAVVGGKSSTTLAVSTKELLAGLPLAINIHKSDAEASVYIACGDIRMPEKMWAPSAKMHDRGTHQMATSSGNSTQVQMSNGKQVIELSADNFAYSKSEIRAKMGEPTKIVLNVKQGFHDLVVDELNVRTLQVSSGETTSIEFTPTKKGVFEFYCSVGNHRAMGMVGKIIVE